MRHQRTGDECPAAFALRQGGPGGFPFGRHAQRTDQIFGPCHVVIGGGPAGNGFGGVGQPGQHHVTYAQWRLQGVARVHVADVGAQFAHIDAPQGVSQYLDSAAGGVCDCAEQTQQCAFARAVGAQQCPVLPLRDGQRHVV